MKKLIDRLELDKLCIVIAAVGVVWMLLGWPLATADFAYAIAGLVIVWIIKHAFNI